MSNIIIAPNPYYYGKFLEINDKRSQFSIGDFGKKMNLAAGSNWFIGKDFCAYISYSANDYYCLNSLNITIKSTCLKYYELKKHLSTYESTWHTLKNINQFLFEIFKNNRSL